MAPLGFDPTVPATVAGFMYRDLSLHEVPGPAPYPFATAVLVDGRDVLRAADSEAVAVSQTFDMQNGELGTQLEVCSGGVRVRLNVSMFVSRSMPTIAAMRVTAAVTSLGSHNLTLAPALSLERNCWSPRISSDCTVPAAEYNTTIPDKTMPGWAAWVWDGKAKHMGAVSKSQANLSLLVILEPFSDRSLSFTANVGSRIGLAALPNVTTTGTGGVIYEVLVSVVSDAVSGDQDPVLAAYEHVERAAYLGGNNVYGPPPGAAPGPPAGGFATLQRKDRAAWAKLWQARPIIRGPDAVAIAADQRMIDGAFFYMHAHAHPANTMGVSDYGLSQPGRMYGGGIMEDFDFLMVLPVALADAAAGAAFARFRTRTLGAAQRLASASGYVGQRGQRPALYPGTASMIDGHPSESAFESWAKDYVGLGAALAVYEAASTAADPAFVREEAWPVLRAVAEFVVARGTWTPRGFEFGLVSSPAIRQALMFS